MSKSIFELKIDRGKLISINIDDDVSAELNFEDNSSVEIKGEHYQDCCEYVYADFSVIDLYKNQVIGKTFKKLEIKEVEEIGFLLCLYDDENYMNTDVTAKILIPCYNEQNGYYSDKLDLIISDNGKELKKIDITHLKKDNIG